MVKHAPRIVVRGGGFGLMIGTGGGGFQIIGRALCAVEDGVQGNGGNGGQQDAGFDQRVQIMRHPLFEIRRDKGGSCRSQAILR